MPTRLPTPLLLLSLLAPACAPALRPAEGLPPPVPEEWAGLIGVYRLDGDTVSVLEREGRLWLLRDGSYRPLDPAGGEARFTRDAQGRATLAVIGADTLRPMAVGAEGATGFRITPVRPVEELRREALAARPPRETGSFREPELVDVTALDPTIRLDVRYATENNFMGARFYDQPRAFLQRPAAEALARASRRLRERGYGLLVHDAYRPWYVTRMFWDATPDSQKVFVADPASGSRHNRGAAVDLSLYDLETGRPVEMPSGYDEFSPRAYPDYPGGTSRQRWHRELLREAMEAEGFSVYDAEWWHFDFRDWRSYPIQNLTFDRISPAR
jgi:D-alanyl-D-alanine dipeptidase